ncbi:MAG: peptidylprolyl isomerase [Candidatus Eremiobacterota bacterium]
MKTLKTIALISLVVLMIFTGCNGKENSDKTSAIQETPSAGNTETPLIEQGKTPATEETPVKDVTANTEEEQDKTSHKSEEKGKLLFEMKTSKGTMKGELYPDVAPNTVLSFVTLSKKKFYNGLTFHRVVPDFVIQGGDPEGTGEGGPGYTIPAEFNDIKHDEGILSMARAMDPDSAGSQFFICLSREHCKHLDNQYAVFGKVTEGFEVAKEIEPGDKIEEIKIIGELPEDLKGKEVKKSSEQQ